jgi:hypothetical protein
MKKVMIAGMLAFLLIGNAECMRPDLGQGSGTPAAVQELRMSLAEVAIGVVNLKNLHSNPEAFKAEFDRLQEMGINAKLKAIENGITADEIVRIQLEIAFTVPLR